MKDLCWIRHCDVRKGIDGTVEHNSHELEVVDVEGNAFGRGVSEQYKRELLMYKTQANTLHLKHSIPSVRQAL